MVNKILILQPNFVDCLDVLGVGDGPIRGIVATSTGLGEVRGYVGSPMLGDIKLTEAVGLGSVQIVKNHPDWPRPYNGITAIRSGDIDRDIGTCRPVPLPNSVSLVCWNIPNANLP